MPNKFDSFLMVHGIISQLCALKTLLQNGGMKEKNQTLMDMVRSMMVLHHFSLPFEDIHRVITFIIRIIRRCLLVQISEF